MAEPSPPPESWRSAHVLPLLGFGTAISLLGDSTLYTVLPRPEIAAEAGVTLAMVGLLLGVNRLVRLAFNGVAGVLYDRLPRRTLLITALAVGALATLLFAFGRGLPALLLSRVLWGAAWSGIWVGGNALVLDLAGEGQRGRLTGQHQMWFFLGGGMTALAGGAMTDLLGFRAGLAVSGGITLLAALLWLRYLPEGQPVMRAETHTGRGAAAPSGGNACRTRAFRRFAASRSQPAKASSPEQGTAIFSVQNQVLPAFPWRVALATALPIFTVRLVFAGVMVSTAILWLGDLVGASLRAGAWALPIATLTGLFGLGRSLVSLAGAPVAGRLSDRMRRRWPVLAAALAVAALGAWLMGRSGLLVALMGAFLAWIAAGATQGLVPAIVGDRVPAAQRGRALSVIYTLGDLGSALGPPLALGLASSQSISLIYRLCAGLLGLTAGFAAWQAFRERRFLRCITS